MNVNNVVSVIKKELRGYFNHPLGYILLAVFLGLSNFFFFRTAFLSAEASLRPFFELLPWFLLFLVPAVTAKALAAEQKEGTLEIVLAQPITELELLIGKFLGDWLFILIALGLTLTLPLSLTLGGKLDLGTVFAQYIGAIFLSGGLVALGILASATTKNQTVAFIIGVFASFILLIIGMDVVVMGLPYPLSDIFAQLSIYRHFDYVTRGVIDVRDVIYFLSLGFIFLSITYLIFMARKLNRKAKKYQTLKMGIALIVAIAIVVNLFGAFISFRLDFTGQKLYSLSEGTFKVLNGLDDIATVKLYASKELPSQVSLLYRDVKDMLLDYKNASKGKMQFIQKFPDSDEESATEAQQQGIQPVQFNVMKSDEFSVKEGYLGIAVQYGDKKEAIPFVQTTEDLEYQLTSLIRRISTNERKKLVFTTGHGEKDVNKDYQELSQVLSKQYTVESAGKKDLTKKLKGADVVIIAGPEDKFSKDEKANLTTFINSGKSAFLLLDTVDINMQYLFATPNKDSFADFAEQYGVKVNKNLVYDLKSNEQVPFGGGGGTSYILPYPFWPKLVANPKHIITSQLKQLVLPWSSSVEIVEEKIGKAKAEPLLQTSEFAGAQTSNFNVSPDSKANNLSQKGLKIMSTGYALQGAGESGKGRLVVIGDSDFLSQQFMGRYPQAGGLILNSIDWLGQDEILIGIRSKNAQPSQLAFKSEATKNFVRYFNMIGLVVIIVGYGLWRMNRRRKLSGEVYS